MKIRSQTVNTRISFDLCPEIKTALKEKGILSKFEKKQKVDEISSENVLKEECVNEHQTPERYFEKSKSLYEFEDNENTCKKGIHFLPEETRLSDTFEPSELWNNSLVEKSLSPTKDLPSIIFEESGSTFNSFETSSKSKSSSYFTATAKSGKNSKSICEWYVLMKFRFKYLIPKESQLFLI